eukprot:s4377_g2.t1
MYGLSRDGQEALSKTAPASPAISIGSSNSSNNVQLAHVPAEETAPAEEASGSSGSNDVAVLLQGLLQVHHSDEGRHFKAASCVHWNMVLGTCIDQIRTFRMDSWRRI